MKRIQSAMANETNNQSKSKSPYPAFEHKNRPTTSGYATASNKLQSFATIRNERKQKRDIATTVGGTNKEPRVIADEPFDQAQNSEEEQIVRVEDGSVRSSIPEPVVYNDVFTRLTKFGKHKHASSLTNMLGGTS